MARTYFYWDPLSDNILQERDETGTVTAEYTTEPGLYGNLISQNRSGVESQYHFDSLGSTLALTDDNQQVTDTYAYTAFGEVTEHMGNRLNPFRYIGQKGYYRDELTNDIWVRRRSLKSSLYRWTSTDPLSRLDGFGEQLVSTYSYARNCPLRFVDPSGEMEVPKPMCSTSYCSTCGPHHFSEGATHIGIEVRRGAEGLCETTAVYIHIRENHSIIQDGAFKGCGDPATPEIDHMFAHGGDFTVLSKWDPLAGDRPFRKPHECTVRPDYGIDINGCYDFQWEIACNLSCQSGKCVLPFGWFQINAPKLDWRGDEGVPPVVEK